MSRTITRLPRRRPDRTLTIAQVCRASRLKPWAIDDLAPGRKRFPPSDAVSLAVLARLWCAGFEPHEETGQILGATIGPIIEGCRTPEEAADRLAGQWLCVGRTGGLGSIAFARLSRRPDCQAIAATMLDVGAIAADAVRRLRNPSAIGNHR